MSATVDTLGIDFVRALTPRDRQDGPQVRAGATLQRR